MKTQSVIQRKLSKLRQVYAQVLWHERRLKGKGSMKDYANKCDLMGEAFSDCLHEFLDLDGDWHKDTKEQKTLRGNMRWFFHQFFTIVFHLKTKYGDNQDMIIMECYLGQVHQFLDKQEFNHFLTQCGEEIIGFTWSNKEGNFVVDSAYLEKCIPIIEKDYKKWHNVLPEREKEWKAEIDGYKKRLKEYKHANMDCHHKQTKI